MHTCTYILDKLVAFAVTSSYHQFAYGESMAIIIAVLSEAAGSKTQTSKSKGAGAWDDDRKNADEYLNLKFPKKMDVYFKKSFLSQKNDKKFMNVSHCSYGRIVVADCVLQLVCN